MLALLCRLQRHLIPQPDRRARQPRRPRPRLPFALLHNPIEPIPPPGTVLPLRCSRGDDLVVRERCDVGEESTVLGLGAEQLP